MERRLVVVHPSRHSLAWDHFPFLLEVLEVVRTFIAGVAASVVGLDSYPWEEEQTYLEAVDGLVEVLI